MMPILSDLDTENILPNPVNSSYYYLDDLNDVRSSVDVKTLSLFHLKFRSLYAHFEEQSCLSFHVIGITETRENKDKGFFITN